MLIDMGRAYLLALIFSSVLAWSSFFGTIFFVSPADAGALGIVILYASAAIGLVSLSIVLWQLINRKKN